MKTALPPVSYCLTCLRSSRYWRWPFAIGLTIVGFLVTSFTVEAISHAPVVGWIPDQRVTSSAGFKNQSFRIINPDGGNPTPTKLAVKMSPAGWLSMNAITFQTCTGGPCPSDGTGWQIVFDPNLMPRVDGTATIRVAVAGITGGAGYTSFTLQVDNSPRIHPPSLGSLPNYALKTDSVNKQATYTALFAIGDDDTDGDDDVESITSDSFTFASSNPAVLLVDPAYIYVTKTPPSLNDPEAAEQEGGHSYTLTAKTVAQAMPGTTVITVTLKDPDLPIANTTSTSFVLKTVASSNEEPSFTPVPGNTFLVVPAPTPNPTPSPYTYHLIVPTDTDVTNLRVTATSSNTNLVKNDLNNLFCSNPLSNGTGTVTIKPTLPLPGPSPGVPQASTITLSVQDDAYVRQTTSFLYIVSPDGGSPVTAYSRPTGVYPTSGVTTLQNLTEDKFLNGAMVNLTWDTADDPDRIPRYDFGDIDDAIAAIQLIGGLDISLDLQNDACYTFAQATQTWCDMNVAQHHGTCPISLYCDPPDNTQFVRAVPWDQNLRTSRDTFLGALRDHLNGTNIGGTPEINYIEVINTNLPGIETGIRTPDDRFSSATFDGYTRPMLLWAIQDELQTALKDFPGKLIQIGFFTAKDDLGPPCTGNPPDCYPDDLWQWLYKNASALGPDGVPMYKDTETGTPLLSLSDEFNGVLRPRVSFFQETLAAARTPIPPVPNGTPSPTPSSNAPNYSTPPGTTAYTYSPLSTSIPSFGFYNGALTNDTYNNGIVFQANTVWSNPFVSRMGPGVKYTLTVNGSPNDALEAAFNAYHSEYLEVFQEDIDQAIPVPQIPLTPMSLNAVLWAGQLQSWHDYAASLRLQAPLEAPAGLNVTYVSPTQLKVSCSPVYKATSYVIQTRPLTTPASAWITAPPCDPTAVGGCLESFSGAQYLVRVAANGPNAAYSYAAIFLSESGNDGYISRTGMNYQNVSADAEPGIKAGEPGMNTTHDRGFLSFHTGDLGSVTILGAKLRLYQSTPGTNLTGGQCMVDINNGYFGSSAGLNQKNDYSTSIATTTNAFSITNAGQGNWFEANLTKSAGVRNIKLDTTLGGVTQFRIYFTDGNMGGRYEGWYSGDSATNPPQLLVRYQ